MLHMINFQGPIILDCLSFAIDSKQGFIQSIFIDIQRLYRTVKKIERMKQFEYSKKHTESSRFLHVKQTGKEILIERVKFQFSPIRLKFILSSSRSSTLEPR